MSTIWGAPILRPDGGKLVGNEGHEKEPPPLTVALFELGDFEHVVTPLNPPIPVDLQLESAVKAALRFVADPGSLIAVVVEVLGRPDERMGPPGETPVPSSASGLPRPPSSS